MNISQDDILRSRTLAVRAFDIENNAGRGFDPASEIDDWTLVRSASSTDDVSVYSDRFGGDVWVFCVGTDGTGSDDSRWAVQVGAVGVTWEER
jgi:hypothetical protein